MATPARCWSCNDAPDGFPYEFPICKKCWGTVPVAQRIKIQFLFAKQSEGGLGLRELILAATELLDRAAAGNDEPPPWMGRG